MASVWGVVSGISILCMLVPLESCNLSRLIAWVINRYRAICKIEIPFTDELRKVFAYGQVSLTPQMFLLEVLLSVMCFPVIGRLIFHSWVEGAIFAGLMTGYATWWPFHKYRRRQEAMLSQFQFLILLMAMVMKRGGQPDKALQFAAPLVGAPLSDLLNQAINRMESADTLEDAVYWLAEQTGLVVAMQWANQIVQSDMYHTKTVDRLLGLIAGERKKRKYLASKRTERKRLTALFVTIGLIGIPIVFFTGYVLLHNVLKTYNTIHFI
jgi:hypothetical protein